MCLLKNPTMLNYRNPVLVLRSAPGKKISFKLFLLTSFTWLTVTSADFTFFKLAVTADILVRDPKEIHITEKLPYANRVYMKNTIHKKNLSMASLA